MKQKKKITGMGTGWTICAGEGGKKKADDRLRERAQCHNERLNNPALFANKKKRLRATMNVKRR